MGAQKPPTDNTPAAPFDGRLSGIFLEHHDDARVLLSVKITLTFLMQMPARHGFKNDSLRAADYGLVGTIFFR